MGGVLTFIALARLAPSDQTLSLSCLKFKLTKCTAASTSLPGSKTFTVPRLCAAIVDRLTFAGQIIEAGTTSYRLARARTRRAAS